MPIKEYNFSQQELDIILAGEQPGIFDEDSGDYIRLTIYDASDQMINIFESNTTENFKIYKNDDGNIYVKPNEILFENQIPEANYTLQFDFLKPYLPSVGKKVILKQISPSRLEVRLKYGDGSDINKFNFESTLGIVEENTYNFDWILFVGGGVNIPIVNYTFDP